MMVKDQEGSAAASWYVYTADDERIGVLNSDAWTWSLRGFDHELLRQFKSSNSAPSNTWLWVEDYVYRGSLLLASERVPEEGGRRQFHLDHLGTPRMITSPSGVLIALHDLTPFGSDMSDCHQETSIGFDREEPRRFTGHERDFVAADGCDATVLDYMHARYYNGDHLLSVDPGPFIPEEPQSWNRYAYVLANPLGAVDPDGMIVLSAGGARHNYYWAGIYFGWTPWSWFDNPDPTPANTMSVATYQFFADVETGQFTAIPTAAMEDTVVAGGLLPLAIIAGAVGNVSTKESQQHLQDQFRQYHEARRPGRSTAPGRDRPRPQEQYGYKKPEWNPQMQPPRGPVDWVISWTYYYAFKIGAQWIDAAVSHDEGMGDMPNVP
jgi:RHS repeat-associated protein